MSIQTTGYAIVQYGYAIFGVGATQEEAWTAAAEWLEEPMTDDSSDEPRVDGEVYCLPATAALIDAVQKHGGQVSFEVEWPDAMLAGEER